ncbi:MAG: ABC transporter ATP-binding protein [Lentisphaerae bacterium]|nr:ABC transporter ATP-binding protein [Lentisphaerota bacterium]
MSEYKKEFFDREYSAKEAYGRVWGYARKYRARIFLGILCGMLTAGTFLPLFQVIQPTLEKVSENEARMAVAQKDPVADVNVGAPAKNKLGRQMDKASRLPSWYPQVERLAAKAGIRLQDESGAMGGAMVLIVVLVVPLVALARLATLFLSNYCLTWAGSHVVADLRVDMLRHIQKQSMQFHGRIDVGQLMSRATGDPAMVQMIIQTMLMELAQAPFEILISVGFIIWFAIANHMLPTLVIIVVGFPLFMVPVVMLSKAIRKWSRKALERGSVVGSRMHEILTCIKAVKAYDCEEFENMKYVDTNNKLLKSTLRAVRLGLFVGPAVETVGIFLISAFIVWCFFANVTLANILPMLAPLLLIYKPLKQLSKLQVQIEQGRASLQRIWSLMDVNMALPENPNAVTKSTFDDRIVFDDVSFGYDTAECDAVSHASFEIRKGSFVAVVGTTGSGKSTMSALLSRFFDPREGRVMMDGVDLRDIRISDLRRLVGSVQQETTLFNESIEENIRYGTGTATHDEVVAAAKLANAHEFIMSQPEGYSRTCGEKGLALSGGERQRIAIARAILKNPPILILDEATSALDTVTERLVQDALVNLMKNRTVFAIAHRLSTIRNADLILVMDHGRIVEHGSHDELYRMNGVYRRLCDMQHQR